MKIYIKSENRLRSGANLHSNLQETETSRMQDFPIYSARFLKRKIRVSNKVTRHCKSQLKNLAEHLKSFAV